MKHRKQVDDLVNKHVTKQAQQWGLDHDLTHDGNDWVALVSRHMQPNVFHKTCDVEALAKVAAICMSAINAEHEREARIAKRKVEREKYNAAKPWCEIVENEEEISTAVQVHQDWFSTFIPSVTVCNFSKWLMKSFDNMPKAYDSFEISGEPKISDDEFIPSVTIYVAEIQPCVEGKDVMSLDITFMNDLVQVHVMNAELAYCNDGHIRSATFLYKDYGGLPDIELALRCFIVDYVKYA